MRNPFGSSIDNLQAGADYVNAFDDRFRSQVAGRRAAPKIAAGDFRGAAADYGAMGMPDQARAMVGDDMQDEDYRYKRGRQEKADAATERAKIADLWLKMNRNLRTLPDPQARLQAFTQSPIARLTLNPDQLQTVTPDDFTDQNLSLLDQQLQREIEFIKGSDGGWVALDKSTAEEIARGSTPQTKPFAMDPDKTYVLPADQPVATADLNTDAAFEALIQQESGGRPGIQGAPTPYGRAEGMTQMLPATAEEMARKVGLPWNPSLMRGDTPRAIEYQRRLGRAYFEEGLQKYGGDLRKALLYYHGGPDERLWGPKTNAYADQVLERLQRTGGAPQGGGGGYRVVQQAQPKPREAPSGYRWNGDELEPIPGGPADKTTKNPQAMVERAEKARRVISTIDDALSDTGGWTAGFIGGNLASVKGTPAYNLARQVETIKANLGFEELQRMREASPTGGALGQVAVQELVALQATVANLDTGQSPDQLRANLQQIRKHYTNWLEAVGQKPPAPPSAGGGGGGVIRYDANGNRVR